MKTERDDGYYLERILKHCLKVEKFTKRFNGSLQMLEEDDAYEQAVVLSFIQIGEAAKQLSDDFVKRYDGVDWKEICKFRDKITHHYDEIEEEIIWDSIEVDIPMLKTYCKKVLKDIQDRKLF